MTQGRNSQIKGCCSSWGVLREIKKYTIFSHRDIVNWLYSLTQATWSHNSSLNSQKPNLQIQNDMTNLWFTRLLGRYTKSVSKFSLSSFFSSPISYCLSLPSFPLVWPGCYLFWLMFLCLRSLALWFWLSGPADRSCTVPTAICLSSGPCVYLLGSGSLVLLVSGVVSLLWCSMNFVNKVCASGFCHPFIWWTCSDQPYKLLDGC